MHPAAMEKHRREQRPPHRNRTGNLGTRPSTLLQVYATAEWVAHDDGHHLHDRLLQVLIVRDLVRSSCERECELVTLLLLHQEHQHVDCDECVGNDRHYLGFVQVTKRKNHGRASRSKERPGRIGCGMQTGCQELQQRPLEIEAELRRDRDDSSRQSSERKRRILMKSVWL